MPFNKIGAKLKGKKDILLLGLMSAWLFFYCDLKLKACVSI